MFNWILQLIRFTVPRNVRKYYERSLINYFKNSFGFLFNSLLTYGIRWRLFTTISFNYLIFYFLYLFYSLLLIIFLMYGIISVIQKIKEDIHSTIYFYSKIPVFLYHWRIIVTSTFIFNYKNLPLQKHGKVIV